MSPVTNRAGRSVDFSSELHHLKFPASISLHFITWRDIGSGKPCDSGASATFEPKLSLLFTIIFCIIEQLKLEFKDTYLLL